MTAPSPAPTELGAAVRRAIAVAAEADPDTIGPTTELSGLGLDSLDFSTILIEIEDELDLEVPADVLDQLGAVDHLGTVADVVELLAGWTGPAPTGAGRP